MIRAILFDFDGVLVPIDPIIKQGIKQSIIEKYGYSASVTFEEAKFYVEKAIKESKTDEAYFKLADVAVRIGTHDKGAINALFHKLTRKRTHKLHKSVIGMLSRLHKQGIKLGIVTLSSKDRIEQTLKNMQIRKYFCSVESAAAKLKKSNRSEWKKEAFMNFLNKSGFKPEEVLSVGDSFSIDLEPAIEMGMRTAMVIDKKHKDINGKKCLVDYELTRRMLPTKILEVVERK